MVVPEVPLASCAWTSDQAILGQGALGLGRGERLDDPSQRRTGEEEQKVVHLVPTEHRVDEASALGMEGVQGFHVATQVVEASGE